MCAEELDVHADIIVRLLYQEDARTSARGHRTDTLRNRACCTADVVREPTPWSMASRRIGINPELAAGMPPDRRAIGRMSRRWVEIAGEGVGCRCVGAPRAANASGPSR